MQSNIELPKDSLIFDLQTFAEGGDPTGGDPAPVGGTDTPPVGGEPTGGEPTGGEPTGGEPPELDWGAIKLPDGVSVTDEFKEAVKGFGMNQENAQKLADMLNSNAKDVLDEQESERTALLESWEKESRSTFKDDELEVAKLAYKNFAPPELKEFFDKTGIGTYPPMIRLFLNIGQKTREGSFVQGSQGGEKSTAEKLFSKSLG